MVFDGRKIAEKKEIKLKGEIKRLREKGLVPKLVSFLFGEDKASKQHLSLKKKAAERVEASLDVRGLSLEVSSGEIIRLIKELNKDKTVHGILVQLPLPGNFSSYDRDEIINSIAPEKDVDGMRDESLYTTPAVKAVLVVIKESASSRFRTLQGSEPNTKVVVLGARGFVGGKIIKTLEEMGYQVTGLDIETKNLKLKTKNADILISATGSQGLIKEGMVKKGAVVIDVGAPKGDVDFDQVSKKASFITPVPGGIGPVTISCLLENLVKAALSA